MSPDVRAGSPGGTPWDGQRPIDGQEGYYWRYYSVGSDVRLVFGRAEDGDVVVGEVRPDPSPVDRLAPLPSIAYDTEGEWVVAGPYPGLLVRWVAEWDRAGLLGAEHGAVRLADLLVDPDTELSREDWVACRELADGDMDDGSWWDSFGPPGGWFSGLTGDITPPNLLELVGANPSDDNPDGDRRAMVFAGYREAFLRTWRREFLRRAGEILEAT